MQPLFFIVFLGTVVVILIFVIYNIILGDERSREKDELQISSGDLLTEVNILYKQKKYPIAENLAKKYLEKKPKDNDIRSLLVRCLHDSGKVREAIEHANIILKNQPENHSIKIFLANCHLQSGDTAKAISMLNYILEKDPNHVVAIRELAKIYMDTNQKQSAIKMYKQLDDLIYSNQEKASNRKIIAGLYTSFGEYADAIEQYKLILEIYPTDIEVKKSIIDLYKKNNDFHMAIEEAKDLYELQSNSKDGFWALEVLSNAYLRTNDYEKALEYAYIIKDHALSNKVEAYNNISNILIEMGRMDESIEILNNLVAENTTSIQLKKTLAKSYLYKEDFESAISVYKNILDIVGAEQVKQIHFELSNLYSSWAAALFKKEDFAGCFKKFALALQYDSSNADIYYRLGNTNQIIKNFNEAISQYKKAIEIDPENAIYYSAIAECYAEVDNIIEEKRALIESIKYGPSNPKVHFRLGRLYESQHDTVNALSEIQKAVELDDDFLDAKYKLAVILESQGKRDEAIELYEQILIVEPEHEGATNNLKMLI